MTDDELSHVQGAEARLLGPREAPAVAVINPAGRSPFLLLGDHAGNAIPRALGALGVGAADRVRHVAWDIGVGALGAALAGRLDAVFVRQTYSRLVIDCNRDPRAADAIPETSDGTAIPGNFGIGAADRAARIADIHEPYQRAIAAEIARRAAAGQGTVLVSLHSFTPVMAGVKRPWEIGVLHGGGDEGFARHLLDRLRGRRGLVVGDNQPYRMDATDHTVPRHAFAAGWAYAELEIRQDLLSDTESIAGWTEMLAEVLSVAERGE